MSSEKRRRRVLIVSGGDKSFEYFSGLLPPSEFGPISRAKSAGEARRALLSAQPDIMIVDAPLPDELGVELALSAADMSMGIMLLVRAELMEKIASKVEEDGILTVQKPNSRQMFYSSVKLLSALSARLQRMEKKNRSMQDKMEDIRAVNRAKWLLIEKLGMTESDAHYLIEKRAMDERLSRREIAAGIIRTYDN